MRACISCRSLLVLKQCIRKRCNNEGSLLWLVSTLLLFFFLLSSLPIASAERLPLVQSSLGKDLRDWIHARCGCGTTADDTSSNDAAIWVYEGALFDPLQGKKIATVQGVELVRCVATMDHGSTSTSTTSSSKQQQQRDYQATCGDLECAPLLTHPNATFEYAATLLSRKLFCYTSTTGPSSASASASADHHQQPQQQLLTTIKLNPNAPRRKIPLRQTIVGYDTATTFIARNANSNGDQEEELIAHTEWPDRQTIWGRATRNWIHQNEDNNSDKSNPQPQPQLQPSLKTFDFTIYARQKSARKKPDQLFDLTTSTTTTSNRNKNNNNNATMLVASPRRAKWIEFGTSSSNGKDKFGARETYTYTYTCSNNNNIRGSTTSTTTNPPLTSTPTKGLFHPFGFPKRQQPQRATTTTSVCRVRYSRYGEGPPFVGPGRICSLELQGRRVTSLDEIPPLVAAVMAERVSSPFVAPALTTNTGVNNNNNKKMMEWFRSQSPTLPLCPATDDDHSEEDFWLPDYLRQRGQVLWHKLKGRPPTKRDDGTSS